MRGWRANVQVLSNAISMPHHVRFIFQSDVSQKKQKKKMKCCDCIYRACIFGVEVKTKIMYKFVVALSIVISSKE